jgi:DNA-binding MarR family transcriptional regulator
MASAKAQQSSIEALALESFLPYRLSILANRVSRAIARRYAREFDLSIPEWRVIALLGRRPGLTAGELAEAAEMDKVAISRAVARLATAGRIAARADPRDARRQILTLSAAGARVHARIAPVALECERRLVAALTTAEKAALDGLIDRLLAGAGQL